MGASGKARSGLAGETPLRMAIKSSGVNKNGNKENITDDDQLERSDMQLHHSHTAFQSNTIDLYVTRSLKYD